MPRPTPWPDIQAGYPTYSPARVDAAADIYIAYLTGIGVVSIACWLFAIRSIKRGRRWALSVATAMFVAGAILALTNLVIKDTSGDTGLSPLLGWTGTLACAAGLLAVILLWRRRHR